MSKIGAITASLELGTFSLDEYLEHPESRMQAICVLHKGQMVYENIPDCVLNRPICGLHVANPWPRWRWNC